MNGECIANGLAPLGNCLFGDDVIVNETVLDIPLPSVQMSCDSVLSYVSSLGLFSLAYCLDTNFRSVCCNTCKSKLGLVGICFNYFYFYFFNKDMII